MPPLGKKTFEMVRKHIFEKKKEEIITIRVAKSGLSLGFFLRHLSTKSLISSEKTFLGSLGGGWLTMYSSSSKMAIGFTPGVRGVRGCGEGRPAAPSISSVTWEPKSWTRVDWSGGGMGYWPRLISRRERPRDHKSLATEYCEPWKNSIRILEKV